MNKKTNLNGNELWIIYNGQSWPVCNVEEIESMFSYVNSFGYNIHNFSNLIDIIKSGIRKFINKNDEMKDTINKRYIDIRDRLSSANFPIMSATFSQIGNVSELEDVISLSYAADLSKNIEDINATNNEFNNIGLYPIFEYIKNIVFFDSDN